ncbi:MAG: molybdenum hydroxylase, partial [Chloroflexota bacterium]
MSETAGLTVLIKGGGEVASGVAHRLHRSRLRVCLTEVAAPRAVSRGVTFSEAVFDGIKEVMGVRAELVLPTAAEISRVWRQGDIPIVVDPEATVRAVLRPAVLVDAIMAKRN